MDIIEYTFLVATGALVIVSAWNLTVFWIKYRKWEARKHGRNNKMSRL